jgi:N-acetylneuraminate synthase
MGIQVIAEIGINHNGSMEIAKKLIDIASVAGCTHVKFQKRNPEEAVPEHKKNEPKTVPWYVEPTTYLQYKKDIEFSLIDMQELIVYASQKNLTAFASVWDFKSVDDMRQISNIVKIPSALITNLELLRYAKNRFPFRIMSTGMSTESEIEAAVKVFKPHVIMHTNSVYPTPVEDLNLGYIRWLDRKYPEIEIGYSSHYYGTKDVYPAMAMGITWLEKHITLDHSMWGSDQKASVEPHGLMEMMKSIKDLEAAMFKGYESRKLFPGEEKKRSDLRK